MWRRWHLVAAIAVLIAPAIWLALQWSAAPHRPLITHQVPRAHGGHQQLVVLLHGYQKTAASLDDVRNEVERVLPDADVMVPEFSTSLLSNVSAVDLANALSDAIEQEYERQTEGYRDVILVGHSIGSLLARKAYVIGRGETEEVSQEGFRQRPKQWAGRVSRIVLMAGMNRGWSISAKSGGVAWPTAAMMRISLPVVRWLDLGQLILGLQRGAPFVSNLSLQWLNLIQQGASMPVVTQLLGTEDDLVFGTDNVDLYSGRDFFYRRVFKTGHANIVDFQDRGTGEERREALKFAVTAPVDSLRKNNEYEPNLPAPDRTVQKVIFVMHGIRDFGDWTERAAQALEAEARSKNIRIKVITSGYGYFSMGGFLLFRERQKNVRWFVDRYTEARALYPEATVDYLGHSNGTYLLASALENYQSCKVDRVVFAGSVVRRDFRWSQLIQEKRVTAVRNYVATADWVVGFFPYFFELLNSGDVGGAGLLGFTDGEAHREEVRYVEGEHGAGIGSRHLDDIAAFLIGPALTPVAENKRSDVQNGLVLGVARVCWVVWLTIIAVLAFVGYLVAFRWRSAPIGSWPRLALYVFLVGLILNTA